LPPDVVLKRTLKAVALRMRAVRLIRRFVVGLVIGLAPTALYIVCYLVGALGRIGLAAAPLWYAFVPLGVASVVGAAWGLWGRVSDFEAARAADQALGLRERLGSAVALANRPPRSPEFLAALIEDAAFHCESVRPKLVTGPLLRRQALALPLLGCVTGVLFWMAATNHNPFVSPKAQAERQAVQEQGKRLLDIAREIENRGERVNLQRALGDAQLIDSLGKELARGTLGKREAMKKLAELSDDVRAEHDRLAKDAGTKDLTGKLRQAAAEEFSNDQAAEFAKDLAAGDVYSAEQKLSEIKSKLESGEMSAEEQKSLAEDLERLGKALEGTDLGDVGETMKRAAEALRQGEGQQASEELKKALEQLAQSEAAQKLSEMEQLEALQRELEFSEDQVARGGQQSGADNKSGRPGGRSPSGGDQRSGGREAGERGGQEGGNGSDNAGAMGDPGQTGPGGDERDTPQNMQGGSTDEGTAPFEGQYIGGQENSDKELSRAYKAGDSSGSDVKGRDERARGRARDVEGTPSMDVRGVGPHTDAVTPYYKVRPPTKAELEDALDRESIPAAERPLVQGYFDRLGR